MNKKEEVLDMLNVAAITSFKDIEFIEADLTKDLNWTKP